MIEASPSTRFEALSMSAGPFDLAATLGSGQVFHWDALGGGAFAGAIGDVPVVLRQQRAGDVVEVSEGARAIAGHYLAADHDVAAIRAAFPAGDPHLAAALAFCPGLRILRQPRWECLATFITSSLKQVAHIRQMSLALRRAFGAEVQAFGREFPLYPSPEALAAAGEDALRRCGLGYRARSLHRAAQAVAAGDLDLEALAREDDDDAVRAALCSLHGVGPKIADCVLLFAYGRLGAFPIDVWVERVLRQLYFARRRNVTPRRIREFAWSHFGPHRGYAQQFLFHYARHSYSRSGGFSGAGGT